MFSSTRQFGSVLVLTASLFIVSFPALAQDRAILVDQETGRSISLENQDGKTLVTDLETGESLVVLGELAGDMTDDEYTTMMNRKREINRVRTLQGEFVNSLPQALTKSGTFSISGGTNGKETSRYSLSPKTAKVTITGTSSRPGGDYVKVTLLRYIPFWFDIDYGTNYFPVTKAGKTSTQSWSIDKGTYYLRINKEYNSYWAKGSFTLTN